MCNTRNPRPGKKMVRENPGPLPQNQMIKDISHPSSQNDLGMKIPQKILENP